MTCKIFVNLIKSFNFVCFVQIIVIFSKKGLQHEEKYKGLFWITQFLLTFLDYSAVKFICVEILSLICIFTHTIELNKEYIYK